MTIQPATNSMSALNFTRSAMAPMIRAGVMIANISWYMAKVFCDTQPA
jgi:hypothetical protein